MRREVALVLLLGFAVGGARAGLVGLSDPSEGRYAQIAWESSGDRIVPRWNGVVHLEKPPLAYWAGAAGIALFGRNELGVRCFALLALLAAAYFTARVAAMVGGARAAAPAAALCLLPYPLAVGAALLTDGFVMLAAAMFHFAAMRRLEGSRRALDLAPLALAIGFLAKGHVVLLFTVLPLALARTGVLAEAFRPLRVAALAALVAPWFVAVEARFPGFIAMHAAKLVDFLGTGAQHHHEPVYVYAGALVAGMFPLVLWIRSGLAEMEPVRRRALLLWLLVPVAVLLPLRSRHWTYVLPCAPVVAVLGARGVARGALARRRIPQGVCLVAGGVAAVAVAHAASVREGVRPAAAVLGGACALAGIVLAAARRRAPRLAAVGASAAISAGVVVALVAQAPLFHVHRDVARFVASLAGRDGAVTVVAAKVPSLPFYLGRLVEVVAVQDRLAEEARRYGGSPFFRPDRAADAALREPSGSVIVVEEELRRRVVPARKPVFRSGALSVLAPTPARAPPTPPPSPGRG